MKTFKTKISHYQPSLKKLRNYVSSRQNFRFYFNSILMFLVLNGIGFNAFYLHGQTLQEPDYKAMAEYINYYDYVFEGTVVDFKGPVKLKDKGIYNVVQVKINHLYRGKLTGQYVEPVRHVTGEVVDPETGKKLNFGVPSHDDVQLTAKTIGSHGYFFGMESAALKGNISIKGTDCGDVLKFYEAWSIHKEIKDSPEIVSSLPFGFILREQAEKLLKETFGSSTAISREPVNKKKRINRITAHTKNRKRNPGGN